MKNMATVKLTPEESLVLFDFLSRYATDNEQLEVRCKAEHVVLCDICCLLEKQLVEPFNPDYSSLLEAARTQVSGEHSE